MVAAQALTGFSPQPGRYHRTADLGPSQDNPRACVFEGATGFSPDVIIPQVNADGSYQEQHVFQTPEGEMTFDGHACQLSPEGRGVACTFREQVIPFGAIFGIGDATMIISQASVKGAWKSTSSFHYTQSATSEVSCVGADCETLRSILGLNFWGCGRLAYGHEYSL